MLLGGLPDEPFERPAASQRSLITTLRCLIWYSSMSIMAMSDASILFRTPPNNKVLVWRRDMLMNLLKQIYCRMPCQKSGRVLRRRALVCYYIKEHDISICRAYLIFNISVTCYYHKSVATDENKQIADFLIDLTQQNKNWGFGLCFLSLRNVLGLP